jgi:hypothetical protein
VTSWNADPRTVLEHLIRQRSRTYDEMADDVVEAAVRLGVDATISPRHLRRLASGERASAGAPVRRVLQELFGQPADVLLRPWGPEARALLSTATPEAVVLAPSQEEILAMTVDRARQFAMLTGQYIAAEAVEQLYDDVRQLALAYPQQPLTSILGDIAGTQETILSVLENRHRPAESRQLYLLAGVIGGMLAKASHDMGDSHGALTHSRTAFLCAEHADHDGLRAWTKGLQSFIAYWAKRPHDALRYAQDGALYAQRSGSTTGVWIPVNEARAWAALGNAGNARAAIERAELARELAQADDLDQLGGICTFGRSRQLYYAADALALLSSEADEAERYSQLALDAYSDTSAADWSFSDQAGSYADLAVARIARGELDGAAEAIAPVLALPSDKRIHGIVVSAQRVHAALGKAPEADSVTELQQRIEAFNRTPLAALPR